MAGSGGIGEGERPYRLYVVGEPGALDPLNEERLDDGLSTEGGGNIEDVLATDVAGVKGASLSSLSLVGYSLATESASLVIDWLRNI